MVRLVKADYTPQAFAYELSEGIEFKTSGEYGEIIGRAEFVHMEPSYMVRYVDATGCQREEWLTQSALAPIEPVEGAGPGIDTGDTQPCDPMVEHAEALADAPPEPASDGVIADEW